jgi:ribosomal protein L20
MKDVEFTSIIFVLTTSGVQDGDSGLDQIYADWDEAVPELEERLAKWRATQQIVQRFGPIVSGTRFKNKGDFYSLWSVLVDFAGEPEVINYDRTMENLRNFAVNVDRVPELEDPRVAGEDALAYSQAVRAGTTKGENRTKRKEILTRYIQRR